MRTLLFLLICCLPVLARPGFNTYVGQAEAELQVKTERVQKRYNLEQFESFDVDQDAARIIFSQGGRPRLVCDVQFVGSYARTSHSWLWSWGNPSVKKPLTRDARKVLAYGKKHNLAVLKQKMYNASEKDAWAMTAVAAKMNDSTCAYRAPSGDVYIFMLLKNFRRVVK